MDETCHYIYIFELCMFNQLFMRSLDFVQFNLVSLRRVRKREGEYILSTRVRLVSKCRYTQLSSAFAFYSVLSWDTSEDKDGATVALHDTKRLINVEGVTIDFPVSANGALEDITHGRHTSITLISAITAAS